MFFGSSSRCLTFVASEARSAIVRVPDLQSRSVYDLTPLLFEQREIGMKIHLKDAAKDHFTLCGLWSGEKNCVLSAARRQQVPGTVCKVCTAVAGTPLNHVATGGATTR
jgi:hypothetical protein